MVTDEMLEVLAALSNTTSRDVRLATWFMYPCQLILPFGSDAPNLPMHGYVIGYAALQKRARQRFYCKVAPENRHPCCNCFPLCLMCFCLNGTNNLVHIFGLHAMWLDPGSMRIYITAALVDVETMNCHEKSTDNPLSDCTWVMDIRCE